MIEIETPFEYPKVFRGDNMYYLKYESSPLMLAVVVVDTVAYVDGGKLSTDSTFNDHFMSMLYARGVSLTRKAYGTPLSHLFLGIQNIGI